LKAIRDGVQIVHYNFDGLAAYLSEESNNARAYLAEYDHDYY